MTKLSQNAQIWQGDDANIVVQLDPEANIAGATAAWSLYPEIGAAAILSKATGSGIIITTPTTGLITIMLSDTDTAALAVGVYHHKLILTDGGGNTTHLTQGWITVRKGG